MTVFWNKVIKGGQRVSRKKKKKREKKEDQKIGVIQGGQINLEP